MKVYIGCFGSGLGHASRTLEIAAELLRRGGSVEFSSSGEVADFIEAKGYGCHRLPLADVRYSEDGAFLLKETMLDSPSIIARTDRQFLLELTNIARYSPDVVLSDSSLPTALAGKAHRLPTYTVLNQLNLTSSLDSRGPLTRLFSVGMSAGMGKLWELCDEVLLPDLPPPFTISEKNLWGSGVEKTRYVGFLFSSGRGDPDEAALEFQNDPRPKVFWQISGPPNTRGAFLEIALRCCEALSAEYAFVISGGNPMKSKVPRRMNGFWYYDWCDIPDLYFSACDVVVSRAGHGTIGQSIMSSKPSLLVPIPRQPEQEGNAEKAAKLGISVVLIQEKLALDTIRQALGSLTKGAFGARASKLGEFAHRYNARETVIETLEGGARRGRRGPH